MNWKLALAGLYLASPGTSLFASAQGCPPKPIPIRDIKFFDIDGDNLHNYELRGYAHIKDDAPGGIPRALRIDQLSSYALLKGVDISPSNMQDVTLAIGFYIESIRPAPADAPVPGQVDSYGWIMSHDNGGFDRAVFLHDERFGGAGMSVGYIPDAEPPQVPLQEWIQVVAVWRQGGECSLYIDNEKVDFPEAVIGKNGPGLPDVAVGAPQLRTYHKSNDNDFWIKDVKIFDYALSDQEVDDLNCNFVETLEPTIDCGQGGDLVYSCTECVAGDGSASGCAGDCMWRPEIPHCVEKNDSTDNIVDSVVSCGDHDVADCSHCDVSEDGASGCEGECAFVEGSCRPLGWEPPVDCGNHEAASCGECPSGEGASGCAGDCMWDPSLGECIEDNGNSVSCGTHDAADCGQCDVSEDGSTGCTGECKFAEGSCRPFDWEPPTCNTGAGVTANYFAYSNTYDYLPARGLMNTFQPYRTRTETSINFPKTSGYFAGSGRTDYVAASFEGFVLFDEVGEYKLCLTHDNGAKMFVDGAILIGCSGPNVRTDCVYVTATDESRVKKILVEYFENTGDAFLQLKWDKPSGVSEYIPPSAFVDCAPPTPANPTCRYGAGVTASYFAFHEYSLPSTGLKANYRAYRTTLETTINFQRTSYFFASSGLSDYVAATFDGFLLFDEVGEYRVCMTHDNGAKMSVDGRLVINKYGPEVRTDCVYVTATNESRVKKIFIEYFENNGDSYLYLRWDKPSGVSEYISPYAWVDESCIPED